MNSISVWAELGPRLAQLAGRSLQVRTEQWRSGDQPVYVSDTRRAEHDFYWTPQVSLDEGLHRLWAWAQSLLVPQPLSAAPVSPVLRAVPSANVAFAGPSS